MSDSKEIDCDGGVLDDRDIDRSGDIDQRPLEERSIAVSANIVRFSETSQRVRQTKQSWPSTSLSQAVASSESRELRELALPKPAPAGFSEAASRVQKQVDAKYSKAKSQLDLLLRKIEAQEKRCIPPKLDDDLRQIRFQRQKVLIANGPILAGHLHDEKVRLKNLERFKAANGLTRDAHYPSSPILAAGIMMMLILVEAGINGVLFAQTSDQGLLGGWTEAFVLSLTNIGAAFLVGRLVLPQLHVRALFFRVVAFCALLLGIGLIASINFFGAHYRDFKAESAEAEFKEAAWQRAVPNAPVYHADARGQEKLGQKPIKAADGIAGLKIAAAGKEQSLAEPRDVPRLRTEREAMRKVLSAPADIQSFSSFFLLVIGLCGAVIACWDGYKLDDPFPGYGRGHRRYMEARRRKAEALHGILKQSNMIVSGIAQTVTRKIEDYADEVAVLQYLHHAYTGESRALKDALDEEIEHSEEEMNCHRRLLHKLPPVLSEYDTLYVRPLPELNEKHTKFHETAEKRLKTLQKIAQKEQSDILSIFETASNDFQHLIAETGRTSLQSDL